MIPVKCAPEPRSFDNRVRQRGLSAIDELVGRDPRLEHPGRRREKVATLEADIPPGAFPPFWRDALDDMLTSYQRRCAFLAHYLEHATGNPSVDHMLPKSRSWERVYEWSNYRLCAGLINARKRDLTGIIDPFSCKPGWFALEFVGFQVIRGPRAPTSRGAELDATIELLNIPECRRAREEYVDNYKRGHIRLPFLEQRAPFIAHELRRQKQLRRRDR
jgi:hypothetical protein